jgi:hypothetical protein
VRSAFEARVFGEQNDESMAFLEAVKGAMRDISDLLDPANRSRELSWAREWLATIGINEFNPVRLTLFALHWMDSYSTIAKSIREIATTPLG